MERMTEWYDDTKAWKIAARLKACKACIEGHCESCESKKSAFEQLAKYEQTGLSPAELDGMKEDREYLKAVEAEVDQYKDTGMTPDEIRGWQEECREAIHFTKIVEAELDQYKDTGLSPDQIREMGAENKRMAERLAEMEKAEKNARDVKVGEKVYRASRSKESAEEYVIAALTLGRKNEGLIVTVNRLDDQPNDHTFDENYDWPNFASDFFQLEGSCVRREPEACRTAQAVGGRSMIDISAFKVIYNNIVMRALAIVEFGISDELYDDECSGTKSSDLGKITIIAIGEDGRLACCRDEADKFQFLPA